MIMPKGRDIIAHQRSVNTPATIDNEYTTVAISTQHRLKKRVILITPHRRNLASKFTTATVIEKLHITGPHRGANNVDNVGSRDNLLGTRALRSGLMFIIHSQQINLNRSHLV